MKRIASIAIALTILAGVGCNSTEEVAVTEDQRTESNEWLIREYQRQQIHNGVTRQNTIYPYQFHQDTAELNELGVRDLAILAEHYNRAAGQLNVRRGEAGAELYEARVDAVMKTLGDAGVDTSRIKIADGHPGGAGSRADRVLHVMTPSDKVSTSTPDR